MEQLINEYRNNLKKLEEKYDKIWKQYCHYRDDFDDDIPDDIYFEEAQLSEMIDQYEKAINLITEAKEVIEYIDECSREDRFI